MTNSLRDEIEIHQQFFFESSPEDNIKRFYSIPEKVLDVSSLFLHQHVQEECILKVRTLPHCFTRYEPDAMRPVLFELGRDVIFSATNLLVDKERVRTNVAFATAPSGILNAMVARSDCENYIIMLNGGLVPLAKFASFIVANAMVYYESATGSQDCAFPDTVQAIHEVAARPELRDVFIDAIVSYFHFQSVDFTSIQARTSSLSGHKAPIFERLVKIFLFFITAHEYGHIFYDAFGVQGSADDPDGFLPDWKKELRCDSFSFHMTSIYARDVLGADIALTCAAVEMFFVLDEIMSNLNPINFYQSHPPSTYRRDSLRSAIRARAGSNGDLCLRAQASVRGVFGALWLTNDITIMRGSDERVEQLSREREQYQSLLQHKTFEVE